MPLAITAQGLGKRYRLGEDFVRYLTIRESIGSWRRTRDARPDREHWALRDIDLTVEEGEVVGVIGRNGAGKSTLLKLLARITEPTTGVARTRGRVGSLLEVGTGFHHELTGRENIFLNGAILGLSRGGVRRRFDEIVEFAGVERFLDTPLKRYSSGMSLRLAFAVAAHLDAPIVAVDEVLAVGDIEFQQKCLGKMADMTEAGRTVLFVSHDLGAIRQLCPRTVWLDQGRVRADGRSAEVIEQYVSSSGTGETRVDFQPEGSGPVELLSIAVTDENGASLDIARRDEPFAVRVRFVARSPLPYLDVSIYLIDHRGAHVIDESFSDMDSWTDLVSEPGEYEAVLSVPPILAAGHYLVGLWIGSTIGWTDDTFVHREVLTLELWPHPHDRMDAAPRVVHPAIQWAVTHRTVDGAADSAPK
jgi:ABC-type polysaccharide/polyol phosphate transport system ATPase subunit